MYAKTLFVLFVTWKMALFQNIVAGKCLDARNITYTVKCNFEHCRIPGQYCDQSDSNFPRCANCDEDLCNQESFPGECTLQCKVYSLRNNQEENNEKIQNDCFKEDEVGDIYRRPEMITSLVINGVLGVMVIILMIVAILIFVRKSNGHQTVISHPEDDDKNPVQIATSNSRENVEAQH